MKRRKKITMGRRWGADRICPNGLANLTICSAEVVDFVANPLPIKGRAVVLIAGWTLKADDQSLSKSLICEGRDERE